MPKRASAVGLALLCFGVLFAHVHLGFERIRIRVVTSPIEATEATMRFDLPRLTRLRGQSAAIVARIGAGPNPQQLQLSFDEDPIGEVDLDAGDRTRVDGSTSITTGSGHAMTIAGSSAGWRLESLEIANVHGFSDGPLGFVLVPRDPSRSRGVPWWLALLLALELLVLGTRPEWPATKWLRVAHKTLAAVVVAIFAAVIASGLVTRFAVLLTPTAFLLGVAVLYAGPLAGGVWRVIAALPPARTMARYVPHAVIAGLILVGTARFFDPDTGFTPLIMFGSEFAQSAVPELRDLPVTMDSDYGYDGQFYAQLALDPLLRRQSTVRALDSPGYRARRVLVPATAYLAGLGRTWPVLQIYALINVVCWLVLGWLLLRWLPAGSPAATVAWIGAMTSHGLLVSIRLALSDGPAVLVIALAIAALDANRRWLSAAIAGLAGLAKETSLIAGSILLPHRASRSALASSGLQLVLVLAPMALWLAYLATLQLPGDTAGEGNFALPLVAYHDKWFHTIHELRFDDAGAWESLLSLIALTTQAIVLAWQRAWNRSWWRVGIGYAALMLVVGPAVWEGNPGAVTRVVLPMSIAFNVLLPGTRGFVPLWILGNANLLQSLAALGY